jgi:hypothetical protein
MLARNSQNDYILSVCKQYWLATWFVSDHVMLRDFVPYVSMFMNVCLVIKVVLVMLLKDFEPYEILVCIVCTLLWLLRQSWRALHYLGLYFTTGDEHTRSRVQLLLKFLLSFINTLTWPHFRNICLLMILSFVLVMRCEHLYLISLPLFLDHFRGQLKHNGPMLSAKQGYTVSFAELYW